MNALHFTFEKSGTIGFHGESRDWQKIRFSTQTRTQRFKGRGGIVGRPSSLRHDIPSCRPFSFSLSLLPWAGTGVDCCLFVFAMRASRLRLVRCIGVVKGDRGKLGMLGCIVFSILRGAYSACGWRRGKGESDAATSPKIECHSEKKCHNIRARPRAGVVL